MNTSESITGIKEQFTIKLNPNLRRPVTYVDGMAALIDTGAEIPVLSVDKDYIIQGLNGKCILEECSIGGFGGECKGKVYEIEKLELGKLIFPNIKVFVPDDKIDGFDLIISATMLYGLEYDINTKTHSLTITVPQDEQLVRNVSIESKDGKLVVLLNGKRVDDDNVLSLSNATTNLSQINAILNHVKDRNRKIEDLSKTRNPSLSEKEILQ